MGDCTDRLETTLSCPGLKEISCQKLCQNPGEISFNNLESQRTDQDMGISESKVNLMGGSDKMEAELPKVAQP